MAQIDYFKTIEDVVNFAAGETIFEHGDDGNEMYVVREGEVDILYKGDVMETVTAGGFFGEMALIDAVPRSAKAVATTNVVVSSVNKDRFLFLVHETPTFSFQVMGKLADRIRQMNESDC